MKIRVAAFAAQCVAIALVAGLLSGPTQAQKTPDGVFQLPFVCNTDSNLRRLWRSATHVRLELINNGNCTEVKGGTWFDVMRTEGDVTQIELYSANINHDPPFKSLGLYWTGTAGLVQYRFPQQ